MLLLPSRAGDRDVLTKIGCSWRYCSDDAFHGNVRSLMVLPSFLEDKIKSTFEELERHLDPADMETRAVYNHFRSVWFGVFPPSLWCRHDCLFRTNNFAESFHASLSRQLMQHHPQFSVFARHVIRLIHESRTKLDGERFNPKQRWRMTAVRLKVNALIGNYLNGPILPFASPTS